jgi:hypothetical protein
MNLLWTDSSELRPSNQYISLNFMLICEEWRICGVTLCGTCKNRRFGGA